MNVRATPQAVCVDGIVTLTGFTVHEIEAEWTTKKHKGKTLVLRDGLLFAGNKSLMSRWSDWVDYWAVDFDFKGTFRSVWQDYRTRTNRTIELVTPRHATGTSIAVEVVDIFANEHFMEMKP